MTAEPVIVGTAVLRDYPLRLWAEQREHMDALMREFQLLLSGQESGVADAPRALLELADLFTTRFGALIDAINDERQTALDRGLDRIDSHVPMPEGTPELLERVRLVLAAVDEFCRSGDMLVLPRSPRALALAEWSHEQLVGQYGGAEPTPWPGPFA